MWVKSHGSRFSTDTSVGNSNGNKTVLENRDFFPPEIINRLQLKIVKKIGTAQRFECRLTGGFVNFLVNSVHMKLFSPHSTQLSGKIISFGSP